MYTGQEGKLTMLYICSGSASRLVHFLYLPACLLPKMLSIQTVLKYTNINSLLDECNKSKVSELRLNEVVDDLRSKVQERKSNLLLM